MPVHGGSSVVYDDPLHHATAYFGFDAQKERFSNYFLCPGVADDVQIQAAIDYVGALGGGLVYGEEGTYDISAVLTMDFHSITFEGSGGESTQLYAAFGYVGNIIEINGSYVSLNRFNILGRNRNGYGIYCVTNFWAGQINEVYTSYLDTGIYISGTSNYIVNRCRAFANRVGLYLHSFHDCHITSNACETNVEYAVYLGGGGYSNVIRGNLFENGNTYVAVLSSISWSSFIGNIFNGDEEATAPVVALDGDFNRFEGNFIGTPLPGVGLVGTQGFYISSSEHNIIVGNTILGAVSDGMRISTDAVDNIVHSNIINDCGGYGINVLGATAVGNWVENNQLQGNIGGPFSDTGTGTILATLQADFVHATGGAFVDPVINTSPGGILIDADGEIAMCHIKLLPELQLVVRIHIWAYSQVIEAANNMLLQINAHGATSSELWNTHAIDVIQHPSEETGGIVVGDVIHWVIDAADDAVVAALAACDKLEILAVGEAAVAPDIITNALFGVALIEYV